MVTFMEHNLNVTAEAVRPAALFCVKCGFYRGSASAQSIPMHSLADHKYASKKAKLWKKSR